MNDNKDRKSKKTCSIIEGIVVFLVFLACIIVPIIIHKTCESYNTTWCICTIVFLMIPFGAWGLKAFINEIMGIKFENNKIINVRMIAIVFYFWFMDFVALCIFQKWIKLSIIFGVLAIIIIFYNISSAFMIKKERNKLFDYAIIFDLVLGISLTIYLIYIIPNTEIRNISIPIISAVYGGLITLAGVALTIKRSEQIRQEDETKKAKPFICIINRETEAAKEPNIFKPDNLIFNKQIFSSGKKYYIDYIKLKNLDYSYSCLKGICINNDIMMLEIAKAFEKNQSYYCHFDLTFNYNKEIEEIYLLLQDMMENYYVLELNYKFVQKNKKEPQNIRILSGIELKSVNVDFDRLTISIK